MLAQLAQWLLRPIVIRLIEKLAIMLPKAILEYVEKQKKEKAVQDAKENLEQVLSNKDSSKDEVENAFKDYINSGSKSKRN